MKKMRIMVAIVIGTIVILLGSFCVAPAIRLNSFYNAELRAVSKFDNMNSNLFAAIPTPKGVVKIQQTSNGIISPSTEHGRYLKTDYQIFQTQPATIQDHYEKFFLTNGWNISVSYKNFYTYSQGTACVDIHFYGDNYSLSIWHDFWKQDFSPPDPRTGLLKFFEFGESTFAVCPP